jgi:serine phosphatase RsbU (regulator of sigma subunit)
LGEAERAERYLHAEHAVARALANASGLSDAAPAILQTLCQTLSWDVGALWLVDPQAQVMRCAEHWHRPDLAVPRFEQASRQNTLAKGIGLPGRIWASRQSAWIYDVAQDNNFPRARIADEEGLHSAAGFPISQADEFLGVMEFFSRRIRPLDDELLALLTNIAGQISHFIQRRRVEQDLHQRQQELALAHRIQQRLLPKCEPGLEHFDIAAGCRLAQEVGGDFYDFLHLANGRLAIGIGDASGHGIGAAMLMAHSCACLRTAAQIEHDLEQILLLLNRRLIDDTGGNGFVTLLLASLNPLTRQISYSSAGHLPGYVLDAQGAVKQVLESTGFPLAILPESRFPAGPSLVLEPGELLFLLTDGIVEAFSAEATMFGIDRTLEIVRQHRHRPAREIIAALWSETDRFSDGPRLDDMTAVIVKAIE